MQWSKEKILPGLALLPWLLPLGVLFYGFAFLPLTAIAAALAGVFWGIFLVRVAR